MNKHWGFMKIIVSVRSSLLVVIFLFSGISAPLKAQETKSRELLMKYFSQKTNNWCWAASMQMIMDFHRPNSTNDLTQCNLAKEMLKLQFDSDIHSYIDALPCCTTCSDGCPDGTSNCSGDSRDLAQNIDYNSDRVFPIAAVPDNYDLIFSLDGFTSIQQINRTGSPMQWSQIKQQIQDCRPFIINVQDAPSDDIDGNHAMVVKGYMENLEDNLQLVIANDPWMPCCTTEQEIAIPYDNFVSTTTTSGFSITDEFFVSNVKATIHTIQSGTIFEDTSSTACRSCEALDSIYPSKSDYLRSENEDDEPQETSFFDYLPSGQPSKVLVSNNFPNEVQTGEKNKPSKLMALLKKHDERILGYPNLKFEKGVLEERVKEPGYFYAPVEYISSRLLNRTYFLSCLFPPKKLYKVSTPNTNVVEILNGNVEETVASTLQKKPDGTWMVRKMTTYSYLQNSTIELTLEDQETKVNLTNKENADLGEGTSNFRLVKYYPFQYEFFTFTRNGKEYMSPTAKFGSLNLEKGTAYKEGKVLRSLRRETRDLEKFLKTLFPKPSSYKNYVKAIQALLPNQQLKYSGIQKEGNLVAPK